MLFRDKAHPMVDLSKIERPGDLAQWEAPPIDEVAISVQFNDIPKLKIVHYGELADRFAKVGLTQHEDKAAIPASFEVFGKRVMPAQFQFQAVNVPLPRVWYMSTDKHRLVQVQPDRFIYNWRKVEGEGKYPRFSDVLPEFWDRYQIFQSFLIEKGLPPLEPNQCELSYFNNIDVQDGETYHEAFVRVFDICKEFNMASLRGGQGLEHDAGNFTLTYVVRAKDNTPLARIHANVQAAERGNKPVIRFSIVFRGPWTKPVDQELMEFFGLGREAIVRLFDSMITEDMHSRWGRRVASEVIR
jgi:uncharacterized protein (TIGR04255 family)